MGFEKQNCLQASWFHETGHCIFILFSYCIGKYKRYTGSSNVLTGVHREDALYPLNS